MNKNIKLIINYGLGPLLFLLLSWSLYRQIVKQPELPLRWNQVTASWQHPGLWIAFFLMFVNWGIESRKWQWQLRPLETQGFLRAFRSVLAGCSVTMLTPNRIGEYAGRILFVKEENRIRAIPLTILGSISQLAVTMLAGTIGLGYLRFFSGLSGEDVQFPWFLNTGILVVSALATIFLLMLYFRVHELLMLVSRIRFLKSFVKYITVADAFSRKQLLRILFLSIIRYLVFILQYALVMDVMQVGLSPVLSGWMLTQFFLLMVLAPTIGFTELPVRATVGVAIFGLFSDNSLGIQASVFAIWMINLVVPALIGACMILGVKMMKEA